MRTIEACTLVTPLGPFTLLARDECVVACGFAPPSEVARRVSPPRDFITRRDLGPLSSAIVDYFDGDVAAINQLPVAQPGGPFHEQVWAALRAIPPGSTLTYSQLARKAGRPRAARAAGSACGRNLAAVIVPCHRAVSSQTGSSLAARLNNYYYGLKAKQWLLEHERRSSST